MNVQLMRLRKAAGYSNRDDFAKKIGVNKYTYRSWESGAAMMSVEQVWNCAVALGCTPNDILGWYEDHPREDSGERLTSEEREIVGCYRESTPQWRQNIAMTARAAAGESKRLPNVVFLPPKSGRLVRNDY